jgi:thioredoxin reductase (NADPH)
MKPFDLIIIGAGPAGLTAGIYAGRAGLKTALIEKLIPGGQAVLTASIENYPGFSEPVSGPELMEKMRKQAEKLGVEFIADEVMSVSPGFKIKCREKNYEADCVIAATGAVNRKLGVPGEEEFTGRGVSYCATCDGPLFKNKEIAVVGGGDMAVEEGIYLTQFAAGVTVIHRRERLRTAGVLAERARKNKKIKLCMDTIVVKINGKEGIESVTVKDLKAGKEREISLRGIFIFIGLAPNSGFIKDLIAVDEHGYITTGEDMAASVKGIFAAGDVRKKNLRQIVTACGDGAIAAMSAFKYISRLRGTAY